MSARALVSGKALPYLIQVGVILALILIWDASLRFGWIDPLFLAGPVATVAKLGEIARAAQTSLISTIVSFVSSFILGVTAALLVGLGLTRSRYAYETFTPLLATGITIPKVTLLPLFILWFGIDRTTVVVYGALSAFFPMVINVAAAGLEVRPNQLLLARVMGYSYLATYRKVIFPAMLPVLMSGLFYACNAAMMGVFIVELALSRFGMGAFIRDLAITFRTAELYAAILLTAAITVLINLTLWHLARYFGRWRA
jgi:ABC-type nitrate/sulfonate/bicarbonate transport system permease component